MSLCSAHNTHSINISCDYVCGSGGSDTSLAAWQSRTSVAGMTIKNGSRVFHFV